jgi:hypothetical protein
MLSGLVFIAEIWIAGLILPARDGARSIVICPAKTAYLNLPGTQLARSEEVLEVRFHLHPAVDLENVAGHSGWIQLNVVSRSMPEVPLTF